MLRILLKNKVTYYLQLINDANNIQQSNPLEKKLAVKLLGLLNAYVFVLEDISGCFTAAYII